MRASISDFPNFPQAFGFSAFGFSEMTQIDQALGCDILSQFGRHIRAIFGVLSGVSTGYVAIEFP